MVVECSDDRRDSEGSGHYKLGKGIRGHGKKGEVDEEQIWMEGG